MSNNIVLFISEEKIKNNSDILDNVDGKYISNAIEKMQRAKVLPVLGSDLYYQISDMIMDGSIGATANAVYYNLLVDNVQLALIEFVTAEILVSNTYKITTKGVLQFDNENSTAAELKTIQYLLKRYEDQGEYWMTRTRDYCLQFSKLGQLPKYLNPSVNDDRTIQPDKRTPYQSGIYLRGYYPWGEEREYWRRQDNAPYGSA